MYSREGEGEDVSKCISSYVQVSLPVQAGQLISQPAQNSREHFRNV